MPQVAGIGGPGKQLAEGGCRGLAIGVSLAPRGRWGHGFPSAVVRLRGGVFRPGLLIVGPSAVSCGAGPSAWVFGLSGGGLVCWLLFCDVGGRAALGRRWLFAFHGVLEAGVTGRGLLGPGFVCSLGQVGCWCSGKGGGKKKVLRQLTKMPIV